MPPSTTQATPSPRRPLPPTTPPPTATRVSAPPPPSATIDSLAPHTHTLPRVFDRLSTPLRISACTTPSKRFRQISSSSPPSAPSTPAPKRLRSRASPTSPSPRSATPRGSFLCARRTRSPQAPKLLVDPQRSPAAFPAMFESLSERSFRGQVNYLSATVEVCFEGDGSVDMIGGGQTGTSYSLTGHVRLTLPSLPAELDGRIREIQSLVVRAEGKSEFHDDAGRYAPVRLYETSVRLASPSAPLLIPAVDPSRADSRQIHVAIPFDLRLPGWLPASHATNLTDTSYGLRADIKLGWLDGPMKSSLRLLALSNPSVSSLATAKSSSFFTCFKVIRHRFPVDSDGHTTIRPERSFTLRPDCDKATPIECIVSVPDWVDVNGDEKSLRVSLRVRARPSRSTALGVEVDGVAMDEAVSIQPPSADSEISSDAEEDGADVGASVPMERQDALQRLAPPVTVCLSELGMEVEEIERFSSVANPSFGSLFPLPDQPTTGYDFMAPRPCYAVHPSINETPFRGIRSRQCLLADDGKQRNFFFAEDGLALNHRWRKVNVVLPMPNICPDESILAGGRPQPELESPFLRIRHNLKIKMVVHSPESDAESVIILTTSIRFASAPTTMPGRLAAEPRLPAYIQVFHENGDLRQCDPLPLYAAQTEDACPAPASEALPPVPPYHSLFPEASSLLRVPTPATSIESLRSLGHAGSSSAASSDAMDIDQHLASPCTPNPSSKARPIQAKLSGDLGA